MVRDAMRVLVVDDEPLARQRLLRLLREVPEAEVVGQRGNGREAIAAIEDLRPDLVFLDVQMPEMDGFQVLERLGPERMPMVIFVTAHDQYAIRAFDVHALDYLLKPFDADRFQRAFRRAHDEFRRAPQEQTERLVALLDALGSEQRELERLLEGTGKRYMERILAKVGERLVMLQARDVDWIEAERNYVRLHVGSRGYLVRETMTGLEQQLDPAHFLRIHRSTIVNLDRVKELRPWFSGDYLVALHDGTELKLSRGYREHLESRLRRGL